MCVIARTLAVILPLFLIGCAENNNIAYYRTPANLSPASGATLSVGHLDTGFLFFGLTDIRIVDIDGLAANGDQTRPLLLAPGRHTILIRAFRDPVAAFACMIFEFEAGKTYVAQTTKPEMEATTMWFEDKSTGAVVSKKVAAQMGRDPVMWGPGLKALFLSPVKGPCQPADLGDHSAA